MLFAGIIGYHFKKRTEFKNGSKPIPWIVFERNHFLIEWINLIAVAETKDTKILSEANTQKRVKIFEEYSEGGFKILNDWCKLPKNGNDTYKDNVVVKEIDELMKGRVETEDTDLSDVQF